MQKQVEQIIQQVVCWAVSQESVLAVALVGSQARGTATAESGIDLMFLARQPLHFRTSADWLNEIGWGDCHLESWEDRDYVVVLSRHVQLSVSKAWFNSGSHFSMRSVHSDTRSLTAGIAIASARCLSQSSTVIAYSRLRQRPA